MAFDPIQEDCLRLVLSSMERDRVFPLGDEAYVSHATDVFQKDPSALIRTDRDRSFHLVSKATELLDYRAPFAATEEEALALVEKAEGYLREAVDLDASNWDAKRMLATVQSESDDQLISYLEDNRGAVAADTARLIDDAASNPNPYAREYANDLGRRPYVRWLAATASRLLIAGRYRLACKAVEDALAFAPSDPADVRHTGMLALAKLEVDPAELKRFRSRHARAYQAGGAMLGRRPAAQTAGHRPDAWSLIAQMSLAYRTFDYESATAALRTLMRVYPRAAQPLYFQAEFPEGAFARVHVLPGSEDELVIALSEATPLLQEGMGTPDSASFALWIAEHELVQKALSAHDLKLGEHLGGMATGGGN